MEAALTLEQLGENNALNDAESACKLLDAQAELLIPDIAAHLEEGATSTINSRVSPN
jgi:hypothetical protein